MQRSQSSHSIHRPLSRASTQSAQSPAPDMIDVKYQQNPYMNNRNPEAMLMSYANSQPAPHMDGSLPPDFQAQHFAMMNSGVQFPQGQQQYMPQDPSYMIQGNNDYAVSMQMQHSFPPMNSAEPDGKARKGSSATATNDKELRELLNRNESRSLPEVAQEVIQKERTPQAEKTKQLFAMLWLRKVCKAAKTSVPRNRVYSHYATRCGTERVVPLNPASFGKLVRVIFPGIQTRRLGVRGESKYHYVDLCLIDDVGDQGTSTGRSTPQPGHSRRSTSVHHSVDFSSLQRMPGDATAFTANELIADDQKSSINDTRGPPSKAKLFAYPDTRGMLPENEGSVMYEQNLRFPPKDDVPSQGDDTISLPDIHPFCPPKTDTDTADALMALYRTHCTSLIDCIRFCKEKQFFRLFTSFHGTLTVPVQKLLAHPNVAGWIQAVDTLMYQKMVRFVSRLTLQAAPPAVITILNNIATGLHAHISKTFQSHPAHVLQAKLKPAATFSSLLHRLIRVNAAAHAAANLLTQDGNREQMWREWVTMVNPKRVMEAELPSCGYEEVYKILTTDIRGLLEPLSSPPFPDNPLFASDNQAYAYAQAGFGNMFQTPAAATSEQGASAASTENILDRWATFLSNMPSRFPQAQTRTLLHCISAVGTAALRDITIMGGASYQTWWVMKIFVDEMALWLAAMGGFLEEDPSEATPSQQADNSPVTQSAEFMAHSVRSASQGSRMSSVEASDVFGQLQSHGHASRPSSAQMTTRPHSAHSMHSYHGSFDMLRPQSQHGGAHPLSQSQLASSPHQPPPQQHQVQNYPMPPQQPQLQHRHSISVPVQMSSLNSQSHGGMGAHNMPLDVDTGLDDSGIGLLDEDTLSKFGFGTAQQGGMEIGVSMV